MNPSERISAEEDARIKCDILVPENFKFKFTDGCDLRNILKHKEIYIYTDKHESLFINIVLCGGESTNVDYMLWMLFSMGGKAEVGVV